MKDMVSNNFCIEPSKQGCSAERKVRSAPKFVELKAKVIADHILERFVVIY
jgi:hypothetical protein